MARKTETREIGGNHFRVTQLKVRKANTILIKIVKIVGEPLGAAADNMGADGTGGLVGDIAKGGLADAAGKLVRALGDDDLNWLIGQVLPDIQIQTEEMRATDTDVFVPMGSDHWDEVFAGDMLAQLKLIGFVLELNFGSFFAGVGGLKGAALKFVTPTKSASKPQPTAITGSGA